MAPKIFIMMPNINFIYIIYITVCIMDQVKLLWQSHAATPTHIGRSSPRVTMVAPRERHIHSTHTTKTWLHWSYAIPRVPIRSPGASQQAPVALCSS